ncbi:MAG: hypothetical protein KBD60_09995 [Sterolibacterium sp.]|jgi:hypothetical protein|nr:hypothetical protein [Sterolibacterium sp.]
MTNDTTGHFDRQYQTHLKHLKLKGMQPKTIEAYARPSGAWACISRSGSTN